MSKRGNGIIIVMIFIFLLFFILSMISFYILHFESNLIIDKVKQDVFYIVQNAFFSINKNDFKYYSYKIDENLMKQRINSLIYLNYNDKVKVNSIKYDYAKNMVYIHYEIEFEPVVFKNDIGNRKITLEDNIKLKSMEVK